MSTTTSSESLSNKVDLLSDTVAQVLTSLQSLSSTLEDQTHLLTSVCGAVQVQGERLKRMETKVNKVETHVEQVGAKVDTLETQVGQVQMKIDKIESKVNQTETQVSSVKEWNNVSSQLNQMEKSFKRSLKSLKSDFVEVKDSVTELSSQMFEDKQNSSDSLTCEGKDLKNEANTDLVETLKDDLNFSVKQMSFDVRSQIKDEIETVVDNMDDKYTAVTSRLNQMDESFKTCLVKVKDSVCELKSSFDDQQNTISEMKTCNISMDDKVYRLTNIVSLVNTKLKEELMLHRDASNSDIAGLEANIVAQSQLISNIDGKLDSLVTVTKNQAVEISKIRNGVNNNLSQKIDFLIKTNQNQTKEIHNIDNNINSNVGNKLDSLAETQEKLKKEQGINHKELKADNHSIIDQLMTEASITRNVVRGTANTGTKYIFDFHVVNFEVLVGSGRTVYSRVWHVDQFDDYFKGYCKFVSDKTLSIGLSHGSHQNVLGIQKKQTGKIHWKATVMDQNAKEDNNWELDGNENDWKFNQSNIPVHCDGWVSPCGYNIPTKIACDELKTRGLIFHGKLLIRFEIEVL